jgi:2-phosphosulfolactate phosphatase
MSTVAIDFLPESAHRYRSGWNVVAIDVIRATTTAITATSLGRQCFPVPSIEAAMALAAVLERPVLCGELGGNMPFGFEVTNSPVAIAARSDLDRPLILLSSSGTQLIHNARAADALYLASLRNYTATANHLAALGAPVVLIGAGTRGEFREEDQKCCALIAELLMDTGFAAHDDLTFQVVERWRNTSPTAWAGSRSVDYLRRTGQLHDFDFIVRHVNDLQTVCPVVGGEVHARHVGHPQLRRMVRR